MATSELEKRPDHAPEHGASDPNAEPSAAWGWHGELPSGTRIFLAVSAVFCLLMLYGNHEGFTEDIWLLGIAVALFAWLGVMQIRKRTSWRR